jgi:CheY-like chemotaxis protein
VDIGLPGFDGYELARRFRAEPEGSSVILVALTGYGSPEDRERSRLAGYNHHLVKPVSPEALQKLLG